MVSMNIWGGEHSAGTGAFQMLS